MEEQKLFGIVIFTWEEWDDIDSECAQFYNVNFPFESMKKYNGMDASLDMNGELSVTEKSGECKEVWKGYVCEIPEFMRAVMAKFDKGWEIGGSK